MGLATVRLPQPKWMLCAVVSVLAAIFTWCPGALQHLRYDREAILSGEVWRLFTAHLVQLNTLHLIANLVGLLLVCELLWQALPLRHGVGILLASTFGVNLMLWCLDPTITWYVGLSGVLHGLWAGCALGGMSTFASDLTAGPHSGMNSAAGRDALWIGVGALLLLGVKLGLEFAGSGGVSTTSAASQWIGAPVVTAAHRYGALSGLLYILAWQASGWLRQANPAKQA
ncbi:MAG: Rhomboid family protein [Herminiimonas sp.]|nr:Rhomboid family protein [Herminiimonas sp.]